MHLAVNIFSIIKFRCKRRVHPLKMALSRDAEFKSPKHSPQYNSLISPYKDLCPLASTRIMFMLPLIYDKTKLGKSIVNSLWGIYTVVSKLRYHWWITVAKMTGWYNSPFAGSFLCDFFSPLIQHMWTRTWETEWHWWLRAPKLTCFFWSLKAFFFHPERGDWWDQMEMERGVEICFPVEAEHNSASHRRALRCASRCCWQILIHQSIEIMSFAKMLGPSVLIKHIDIPRKSEKCEVLFGFSL